MRAFRLRWLFPVLVIGALLAWAGIALWQAQKRLPQGLHVTGSWQPLPVQDVHLLRDLTAADANSALLLDQQIDAQMLRMVAQAREFLLLDAGLFGDFPAAGPLAPRLPSARPVAAALADALLKARHDYPDLRILVLVDPSSLQIASGVTALDRLRAGHIDVVAADTARLRAANPVFTGFWQLCCRWWARADSDGELPNPLGVGPPGISFGLWGQMQGFERSHRQLLIADDGNGALAGLILSRSINAEASLHSATALLLTGPALEPMLEAEYVVAQFSGWSGGAMQAHSLRLIEQQRARTNTIAATSAARARVVSEAAIADALIERIDAARSSDSIDIAALYLSQRELVRSLLDAARRGVAVRVMLDPGKDGYGYERSGFPNREVATELVASSDGAIRVRWYRTHGEQFSPGFALVRDARNAWLLIGSAELSRRDLDDLNLAAAFIVELPPQAPAAVDALTWFDTLWFNRAAGGIEYTSDADVYADASQLSYWQYRLLEASGASFD